MYEVSTFDIAAELCKISKENGHEITERMEAEVEEGLFYLKTVASNEYNADYFRTFFQVLQHIVKD